jgi:hypothetical protein
VYRIYDVKSNNFYNYNDLADFVFPVDFRYTVLTKLILTYRRF